MAVIEAELELNAETKEDNSEEKTEIVVTHDPVFDSVLLEERLSDGIGAFYEKILL